MTIYGKNCISTVLQADFSYSRIQNQLGISNGCIYHKAENFTIALSHQHQQTLTFSRVSIIKISSNSILSERTSI